MKPNRLYFVSCVCRCHAVNVCDNAAYAISSQEELGECPLLFWLLWHFENVHNVHACMSLHFYILTFISWFWDLPPQALGQKFITHQLEIIFSCIILSIVFCWNWVSLYVTSNIIMAKWYKIDHTGWWDISNKSKSSLTGWAQCFWGVALCCHPAGEFFALRYVSASKSQKLFQSFCTLSATNYWL